MLGTVAGVLLIGAISWEVFDDLFRPGGRGTLSDWIGRTLFHVCRPMPRLLPLAGPLAIVGVIATWVMGLVLGFGLVYLAAFPQAFRTSLGGTPSGDAAFPTALYFSFETLITLGYGDLVPVPFLLRVVASVEGLVGFGLLTASVSAIVLLYPALARLRLLARSIAQIVEAERRTGIRLADSDSDVILSGLARDVTRTRIDLVHFPMIYYFAAHDPDGSLARWTRQLVRIATEAAAANRPAHVRLAATALDEAISDLSELLAQRFVDAPAGSRDDVFAAFGADHAVDLA